jgi:hypothetical protein
VFVAALEQAEQLMTAAAAVGPAARPLPLFYSLSQAGRAIAAARLDDPWRLGGHGLHVPREDESKPLLRRVVRLDKQGPPAGRCHSFAGVAEATGSRHLTAAVELGAVWGAIPDLIEPLSQPPDLDSAWRRPLPVQFTEWWQSAMAGKPDFELAVDGLPEDLADYPTASTAEEKRVFGSTVSQMDRTTGRRLTILTWPQVPMTLGALDELAPDYRGRRLLMPAVMGERVSPLMLWWLLLFGLSIVARYEPELWIRELDVNTSRLAVPIEAALDVALEALPELILATLTEPPSVAV